MRFFRKNRSKKQKLRGLSLLEALLALGIGGIVITQSTFGLQKYTEGVRIQASASQVKRLTRAADQFAQDNYDNLLAAAPQQLNVDVLAPYMGDNIGRDAFNNRYVLSTRTYQAIVPDPATGGMMREDFLQLLVVGKNNRNNDEINQKPTLRIDLANSAGAEAGFMADGTIITECNGVGVGTNNACGAFGSYVIDTDDFSATNFNNAVVVSLITKGDSSFYGDQLYRYDYGDPTLNTMSTDLHMADNDITDPHYITGADLLEFDGGERAVRTKSGDLTLQGQRRVVAQSVNGAISIDAGGGRVKLSSFVDNIVLQDTNPVPDAGDNPSTGAYVKLRAENGLMRIANDQTVFGDKVNYVHDAETKRVGDGKIWAGVARIDSGQFVQINSLFAHTDDALRIQRNRNNGLTIFGKRVRYNPDADVSAGTYEISDGEVIAQHATVQDITCADCGGSLSQILPRWRHMGTYFIPNAKITRIPKPQCGSSRSTRRTVAAIGDDQAYLETVDDTRYDEKIVIVPRQMAFGTPPSGAVIDIRFDAVDAGAFWLAQADTTNSDAGSVTSGLAQTYCVFTGGTKDPSLPMPDMATIEASPQWDRIE